MQNGVAADAQWSNDGRVEAREYVRTLRLLNPGLSARESSTAIWDFQAGFRAAIRANRAAQDLEYTIAQLKSAEQLARDNSEFYSLAVIRYTLEYLGVK